MQGNGIDIGAFESSFTATSIKETYVKNYFLDLWPNPTHHTLNLTMKNDWRGAQVFGIYITQGQKVMEERLNKATVEWTGQINISQLASRTYYLVLSNGKEFTSKAFAVK